MIKAKKLQVTYDAKILGHFEEQLISQRKLIMTKLMQIALNGSTDPEVQMQGAIVSLKAKTTIETLDWMLELIGIFRASNNIADWHSWDDLSEKIDDSVPGMQDKPFTLPNL